MHLFLIFLSFTAISQTKGGLKFRVDSILSINNIEMNQLTVSNEIESYDVFKDSILVFITKTDLYRKHDRKHLKLHFVNLVKREYYEGKLKLDKSVREEMHRYNATTKIISFGIEANQIFLKMYDLLLFRNDSHSKTKYIKLVKSLADCNFMFPINRDSIVFIALRNATPPDPVCYFSLFSMSKREVINYSLIDVTHHELLDISNDDKYVDRIGEDFILTSPGKLDIRIFDKNFKEYDGISLMRSSMDSFDRSELHRITISNSISYNQKKYSYFSELIKIAQTKGYIHKVQSINDSLCWIIYSEYDSLSNKKKLNKAEFYYNKITKQLNKIGEEIQLKKDPQEIVSTLDFPIFNFVGFPKYLSSSIGFAFLLSTNQGIVNYSLDTYISSMKKSSTDKNEVRIYLYIFKPQRN